MQKKITTGTLLAILLVSTIAVLAVVTESQTEEDIENAITNGVAYLAGKQNPADGSWGIWDDTKTAYTGLVLVKLQMRAYELGYESPFDPEYLYSGNVTAGWSFIFSTDGAGNPLYALNQTLSLQDHTGGASGTVDDPDTNGNGYGIYFDNPWPFYQMYTTGIVLMALEASGTPDRENDGAIDYDGDGFADTFKQIAQDAADWLAYAQSDYGHGEGGWAYLALDNTGNATVSPEDNSNGGYAMLGLAAAEGFGCTVPTWVRTELNVWITNIQDTSGGTDDGGSWYRPPGPYSWAWVNELKAGNLIFEMTFYGDDPTVPRFKKAMDYIVRHWQDYNTDPGWRGDRGVDDDGDGMIDEDPWDGWDNDGDGLTDEDPGQNAHYQAMYCLMKGFEYSEIDLIDLDGDSVPEHDWYDEFATVLVDQQNLTDGSWPAGDWGDAVINTAWALLTLEKITPPPPVITVYVDIKPGSWPNPINKDSKGVFCVAICGTEDFDVTTIDPATILITMEGLEVGVPPLRWSYQDVATPYTGEPGGGHDLLGDGYLDLVLHFDTQEAANTLGLCQYLRGETITLIIIGNLYEEHNETPIQGQDYVLILEFRRGRTRKL